MRILLALVFFLALPLRAQTLERGVTYPIFQFPADRIPRIDGQSEDWAMVPARYAVGIDQTMDTVHGRGTKHDRQDLDVTVKVGWVKGMNKLYFLYEATDNYWDFARTDLHNDTFEIVVDGDLSGGPLINRFHPNKTVEQWQAWFSMHGVHAQNYHIFTPAEGKDWTMVWGCQPWIKELPYANAAYSYNFRPGQPGKLTLEFFVTPFDYAGCDGPASAVESKLAENKVIGLSWAFLDYDDVDAKTHVAFWNLAHKHTMYGNASELVAFRLMPLEEKLRKAIEAQWSFRVLDRERRLVAFQDESTGAVTSWRWEFGDGETSAEQHPQHRYAKAGHYVVTLFAEGPAGKARRAKVWDVTLR